MCVVGAYISDALMCDGNRGCMKGQNEIGCLPTCWVGGKPRFDTEYCCSRFCIWPNCVYGLLCVLTEKFGWCSILNKDKYFQTNNHCHLYF